MVTFSQLSAKTTVFLDEILPKLTILPKNNPKKVESRHSIGQDVVYSMVSWVVEFSIRVSKPGEIFA